MKIINLIIFLIFTLTSTVIKANDLDFKNIKKSISNLESTIDFKNKSLPEYKVLTILDKLATKLNTSNIDKKIVLFVSCCNESPMVILVWFIIDFTIFSIETPVL